MCNLHACEQIDLPQADIPKVAEQLYNAFGFEEDDIIQVDILSSLHSIKFHSLTGISKAWNWYTTTFKYNCGQSSKVSQFIYKGPTCYHS